MGKTIRTIVMATVAVALAMPVDATAHGSCTGERIKNSGKRCRVIGRCYIRAAQGREDLAVCVAGELARLERHFRESEIFPDCHSFGDPPDVIAALDAAMGDVATLLSLGTDRCSRMKMESAGRICLHLLRNCEAPAEVQEAPVDPSCVAAETALLTRLFDKAEQSPPCATTDDEGDVLMAIRAGVDATVTELDVP